MKFRFQNAKWRTGLPFTWQILANHTGLHKAEPNLPMNPESADSQRNIAKEYVKDGGEIKEWIVSFTVRNWGTNTLVRYICVSLLHSFMFFFSVRG